jgi:hypothetical protein
MSTSATDIRPMMQNPNMPLLRILKIRMAPLATNRTLLAELLHVIRKIREEAAKAAQEGLAVEQAAGPDQFAARQRMADLHALGLGSTPNRAHELVSLRLCVFAPLRFNRIGLIAKAPRRKDARSQEVLQSLRLA